MLVVWTACIGVSEILTRLQKALAVRMMLLYT